MNDNRTYISNILFLILFLIAILLISVSAYTLALILLIFSFFIYVYRILNFENEFRRVEDSSSRKLMSNLFVFYLSLIFVFSFIYLTLLFLNEEIYNYHNLSIFKENSIIMTWYNCLYFSIVTATSLGYGDLKPVTELTMFFSMIEISFGPIFIIALITTAYSISRTSRLEIIENILEPRDIK